MANDFVTKLNSAIENSRAKGVPDYAIGAALFNFLDRYQNRRQFMEQLSASSAGEDGTETEEDYLNQLLMGMQDDGEQLPEEMNQPTLEIDAMKEEVPIQNKKAMETSELKTRLDMFGTQEPINVKDASKSFKQPTQSRSTNSLGMPQNLSFAYETAKSLMGSPNITPQEDQFRNLQTGKPSFIQTNNLNEEKYNFGNLPTGRQFLKDL